MPVTTVTTVEEARQRLAGAPSPVVAVAVHDSYEDAVQCLEAIAAHTDRGVAVLVVDDAGLDRRIVDLLDASGRAPGPGRRGAAPSPEPGLRALLQRRLRGHARARRRGGQQRRRGGPGVAGAPDRRRVQRRHGGQRHQPHQPRDDPVGPRPQPPAARRCPAACCRPRPPAGWRSGACGCGPPSPPPSGTACTCAATPSTWWAASTRRSTPATARRSTGASGRCPTACAMCARTTSSPTTGAAPASAWPPR